MIGRTLGHYRIVNRLGSGGMGVVWLAEDLKLGRKVALKVLREDLADSPEKAARFEREARAIAALSHPSIVTLHAVEEIDGVRFLAMEYLEGRTLDQLVREGPLPVAELLRIAIPIAEALEAAHARGILHRDLKPSNVMVCTDGRVKVLDFGLAKLLEDPARAFDGKDETTLTREGQVVGTLHYSSPEQLRQETVDARTDIYSFGAVLYEMATGRVPFQGDSAAQVITAVLCDPPRRIDEFDARAPRALASLVEQCLLKDPDRRPASAGAERFLLNGLAGVQVELDQQLSNFARRENRLRAPGRKYWLGGGLAVLLAGVVALVSRENHRVEQQNRSSTQVVAQSAPPPAAEVVSSVAVLPFQAVSSEPDYLLVGLTDGVIGEVGRVEGVRVISRQSAMHYRSTELPHSEIARQLDVEYLVVGSIERSNDRVRWSGVLLHPSSGQVIWSRRIERSEAEVLALQAEIGRAVAAILCDVPVQALDQNLPAPRVVDPAVFEAFIKARLLSEQLRPDSLRSARELLEFAIRRDSNFAPAHVVLADVLTYESFITRNVGEILTRREELSRRAVELDPDSGTAHAALGDFYLFHRWDWKAAEQHLRRAIGLSPNDSMARRKYWVLLVALGRFREATHQLRVARRLDPLVAAIPNDAGHQALMQEDWELAIAEARRALTLDPAYPPAHAVLWLALHRSGGSESERDRELATSLRNFGYSEIAEKFLSASGTRSYVDRLLEAADALERLSSTRKVPLGLGGAIYAVAGDLGKAEKWILRAYEERSPEMVWLGQGPSWRDVRSRPTIQRILREMKLVPAAKTAEVPEE
ncbi:MAG: hypothetical protein AMXMBFR36_01380 [Acidobacteriota bacterium]